MLYHKARVRRQQAVRQVNARLVREQGNIPAEMNVKYQLLLMLIVRTDMFRISHPANVTALKICCAVKENVIRQPQQYLIAAEKASNFPMITVLVGVPAKPDIMTITAVVF